MAAARPLRDVFVELAGDRIDAGGAEALRASGHGGLPDELTAEAVVSYADTAPIEVAEHLSPFVQANSAVPMVGVDTGAADAEPAGWFDAIASAPPPADIDPTGSDPVDRLDPAADGWTPAQGAEAHPQGLEAPVAGTDAAFAFGQGDAGTGTHAPMWSDPDALDQATAVPETVEHSTFDQVERADWGLGAVEETVGDEAAEDHGDIDDA